MQLIDLLVQPSMALVSASILGLLLFLVPAYRWHRAGKYVLALTAALYLLFAFSPLPSVLIQPLEQRFPRPDIDALGNVRGIVVLGGAIDSRITKPRRLVALNGSAERVTVAAAIAHRYPGAAIMVSNGSNNRIDDDDPLGYAEYRVFEDLGIDRERIIYERHSSDTYENAWMGKEVADPKAGDRWVLVTSASHLPRAVGAFRKAGFDVLPFPVDYRTTIPEANVRFFARPSEGLEMMDLAVKEWIGLVYYWLLGRTSSLYPAPLPDRVGERETAPVPAAGAGWSKPPARHDGGPQRSGA